MSSTDLFSTTVVTVLDESSEPCQADSTLPAEVTYIILGLYLLILFAFSLYAAHQLLDSHTLGVKIAPKFKAHQTSASIVVSQSGASTSSANGSNGSNGSNQSNASNGSKGSSGLNASSPSSNFLHVSSASPLSALHSQDAHLTSSQSLTPDVLANAETADADDNADSPNSQNLNADGKDSAASAAGAASASTAGSADRVGDQTDSKTNANNDNTAETEEKHEMNRQYTAIELSGVGSNVVSEAENEESPVHPVGRNLIKRNPDQSGSSSILTWQGFLSNWLTATWRYKQCYFATITHIVDQVTDIAVCVEFVQLAMKEQRRSDKDSDYCPGVNSTWLAVWSITALVAYRVVSAYSIYRLTKDVRRIFLQLLDFELFRTMYVNYVNESTDPCNPQRMIQSLEAILESTPQVESLFIMFIFFFKLS